MVMDISFLYGKPVDGWKSHTLEVGLEGVTDRSHPYQAPGRHLVAASPGMPPAELQSCRASFLPLVGIEALLRLHSQDIRIKHCSVQGKVLIHERKVTWNSMETSVWESTFLPFQGGLGFARISVSFCLKSAHFWENTETFPTTSTVKVMRKLKKRQFQSLLRSLLCFERRPGWLSPRALGSMSSHLPN